MKPVQDADDALAECCTSHDGIIDDDEVVDLWLKRPVGNVVDVSSEVVTLVAFGDEGSELDILDGNLLAADVVVEDGTQFLT